MYPESQLLPISALQHLLFCERQCALIHVERQWAENRFTVEGQHLHRRAHGGQAEWRGSVRVARRLWVRSFQLGLVGQADVVELEAFERNREPTAWTRVDDLCRACEMDEMELAGTPSLGLSNWEMERWVRVTPIEYKRGRPKKNDSDRVQLCAQALCLEEMLNVTIASGELFYGRRQRRTHVEFDESLRRKTESATARLHQMIGSGETPPAVREKKCDTCSLFHLCLPEVTQTSRSATRFVGRQFAAHLRDGVPTTDLFESMATTV